MSSKEQPKILFLDRNIGKIEVPKHLKSKNIKFELHDDHLPQDSPDEDWVSLCSKNNWIAITLDNRLKQNVPVKIEVKKSPIAIFVIRSGNMRGVELAHLLVNSYVKILKYSNQTKKPFLATITKLGYVTLKSFP